MRVKICAPWDQGKSGRGCPRSSSMEFEAKFIVKRLRWNNLRDINNSRYSWFIFVKVVSDSPKLAGTKSFIANSSIWLYIIDFGIFQNSAAMVMGSSKITTLFLMIKMTVVIVVSDGCSNIQACTKADCLTFLDTSWKEWNS